MKVQQSPQFKSALRSLTAEEAGLLEEGIRTDKTPQVFPYCVVNGTRFQLDGHHRLPLCVKYKVKFSWVLIEAVTSVAEGIAWIKRKQTGGRNLTAEEYRAQRVERVVQARLDGESTRAIAEAEGVSQTTVQNDLRASIEQGVFNAPANGKVKGKDGRMMPAEKPKGRRDRAAPKGFVYAEWKSHFGYVLRGIDDLIERFPAAGKQLEISREQLAAVFKTATGLGRNLGKE